MNSSDLDAEFDPFENDPVKKKTKASNGNGSSGNGSSGGSGAGVAWLALLIGLAAISYNAWQWWLDQATDSEDQHRQLAINSLQQNQSGIQQTLDSLTGRLTSAEQKDESGTFSAIRSDISAVQSRLSELGLGAADDHVVIEALQVLMTDISQRVGDIETSVAALAVRSETPGKSMDLAEVDYLLRLASERLVLFGDARSAIRALGLADTHLEAMEDPLYLPVRRRIAEARQALQELPAPDLVATSSQIAALQASIPGLPFPGEVTVVEEAAVQTDSDPGWWQRLKNAMKPLVTVRHRVNEDLELSLKDKDYLRQGLWLQLESARLALMRNDTTAWNLSLEGAKDSIQIRFAANSKLVTGALNSIEELQDIELTGEVPNISAPWRQLQLLREGRVTSVNEIADDEVVQGPAEQLDEEGNPDE